MDAIANWAYENSDEQLKSDITLLKGTLAELDRKKSLGLISNSEETLMQNQLNDKVLVVLNSIENVQPEAVNNNKDLPLKILMLTANPANTALLRLRDEHSMIIEKLQNKQGKLNFIRQKAVSSSEFKEFTETENPVILHFSGHGEGGKDGGIYVQNDEKNDAALIPTAGLDTLFEYFKYRNLALDAVILNACYSEEQAQVIAKHVTYVVGTTVEIGDNFAIAFSSGFYFILGQPNFSFDKIELAFISGRADAATKGASKSHFVLYKNGEKLAI